MALAPGTDGAVAFTLSPVRFEFLCRVAEGALPGSFSNECLEDMLAFKAKLLRKAELLRSHAGRLTMTRMRGALTLNFIEIEKSGHGILSTRGREGRTVMRTIDGCRFRR